MTMDEKAIVLDIGSSLLKVGISGEEDPRQKIPALIGNPRDDVVATSDRKYYVGQEAQYLKSILNLSHPISRGIVQDWDNMEILVDTAVSESLKVNPKEYAMLITEPLFRQPMVQYREKMIEFFFEKFEFPAVYPAVQPLLGLYASGRTSGIVLDIGEGLTQILPVWEGYDQRPQSMCMELAGIDCTEYLMKGLESRNWWFTPHQDVVREIKEKVGYVALDFKTAEEDHLSSTNFQLPDGQEVSVGPEKFHCAEILFNPKMKEDMNHGFSLDFGSRSARERVHLGIHQALHKSIKSCERDLQRDLFSNIVLSGGTTLFSGFQERLQSELSRMVPSKSTIIVKVFSDPQRHDFTWVGGSILSSLSTFHSNWILKEEYADVGPSIVQSKAPAFVAGQEKCILNS